MPDDNDNLSSIADYYASQGMSNPQLSYDQNGNPIFQSNKLPVDISNLQDYAATLPPATPNPLPTHETWINPIAKGSLTDALTGLGGGERYQLFPERIVRSALSLPTDVMSGKLGPYSDPYRNGPITDRSGPVVSEGGLLSSFGVKPVGGNDPEDELLQRVQDMAALMGGGGVASVTKAGGNVAKDTLGVVPVGAAKKMNVAPSVASDTLKAAVENTPGAAIDPDGALRLTVSRRQRPEQEGEESVRGGVFYLPKGSKDQRYYSGTKENFSYGGSQKIEGETAYLNPLVVKGATGGKAPQTAYNQLNGKGAYEAMRKEALRSTGPYYLKYDDKVELAKQFLEKYAPDMQGQEYNIVRNSTKGNQLPYALQEAAVASAARKAGHDGIIGYSTKKDGTPFLSEIFDVRESHYPTTDGDYTVHSHYLRSDNEAAAPIAALENVGGRLIKPEDLVNEAFHGTPTSGFDRFKIPDAIDEYMPDRSLGVHVAKDHIIANHFAQGTGSKVAPVKNGGVYPVKIPDDKHFLEVDQPLHPYVKDPNTPKRPGNIASDQDAIERLVYSTAFKKDPDILARYLEQARAVPKEDATQLAKDMVAGKSVSLPVDGDGWTLDRFMRNFNGKPYNKEDRGAAVQIFKKEMQDQGYAGLKYINTSPMETAGAKDPTSYIVFDPSKHIKSKYTNTLMSDTTKPGMAIAALEKAPVFHSAVENAVNTASLKSAPPQQWLSTIGNAKGVKPEELDWTGLKDFLQEQKGPVSKEQIQQHLEGNKVELKEVDKGVPNPALHEATQKAQEAFDAYSGPLAEKYGLNPLQNLAMYVKMKGIHPDEIAKYEELQHDWIMAKDAEANQNQSKYSKYQLPGEATNYREKLLTLPEDANIKIVKDQINNEILKLPGGLHANWRKDVSKKQADLLDDLFRKQYLLENQKPFKSSHWDEPNVLAHIRMNDRFIPDAGYSVQNIKSGNKSPVFATKVEAEAYQAKLPASMQTKIIDDMLNKKALHVEEIQSDWHQQGRERGYKLSPEATKQFRAIDKKIIDSNDEQVMGQPEIKDAVKLAVSKKIITPKEGDFYIQNHKGAPDFGVIDKELETKRNDLVNLTEQIRKEHGLPSASEAIKQLLPHEERANLVAKRQELYESDPRYNNAIDELKSLEDERARGAGAIPDAPFKKTWLDLAAKRMIREAAEQGKDVLSWTPGEAQAARYDLSKHIKEIAHSRNPGSINGEYTYDVAATTHKGGDVNIPNASRMTEQDLENTFGKEIAKKIVANEGNSYRGRQFKTLEGLDLKVGGEGMHYFYDKMLPAVLEKLTGQKMKVGNVNINQPYPDWGVYDHKGTLIQKFNSEGDARDFVTGRNKWSVIPIKVKPQPINYIDLPQSVKDTALHKGFPLFSSGLMLSPVEDNPFAKSKYKLTPVKHDPFKEKK